MVIKVNDNGTLKSYQIPTGNPNWNSSQGEQGYIKNRPFYSETGYVEIFSDTYSVDWSSQGVPTGWYFCMINPVPYIDIKENETYKIIFNEVEYILTSSFINFYGSPIYYIGTEDKLTPESFNPENADCPFIIGTNFGTTSIAVYTQDNTISEVSFSVYKFDTTYHKIDSNFIDVNWDASVGNQGYVQNRPFYREISSQEYIAEEQTVSLVEEDGGVGNATLTSVSGFTGFENGEEIKVIVDRNEYNVTIIREDNFNQYAFLDSNSIIFYSNGTLGYSLRQIGETESVTISIFKNVYTYHKLDSNYIDIENTIATQTYVDDAISSAVGDIETLLASI